MSPQASRDQPTIPCIKDFASAAPSQVKINYVLLLKFLFLSSLAQLNIEPLSKPLPYKGRGFDSPFPAIKAFPFPSPRRGGLGRGREGGWGVRSILYFLTPTYLSVTSISSASAHTVKISADVGGTLHIEPNDNPRAGEPTQAWFALTRKGGKAIALKECNCQLAIYAEPHSPGEPALLEPPLKPVEAERYQGTPGAEIIFPKPGAYQLQLNGKSASGKSFQPFELKFAVTVAAGKPVEEAQAVQNVTEGQQGITIGLVQPAILLGILLLSGGILAFIVQTMRGG